jgi:hypothetical protein
MLLFSPLDSLPRMITPNLTRRAALQLSTVAATKYHSDNLEGQSTALTVSGSPPNEDPFGREALGTGHEGDLFVDHFQEEVAVAVKKS